MEELKLRRRRWRDEEWEKNEKSMCEKERG
jgi:hypothetical protein